MSEIKTIGLDLAKNVFHAVCRDEHRKVVGKKVLKRHRVSAYFANLPACLVAMEACAGAHYWGRQLENLGHQVRLIPPQYVKPYVRGNKNDYNDALAISEAVREPEMRFVAIKTVQEQDVQALYRLREQRLKERTALCNQMRGLIGEYGLVMPRGIRTLQRRIPELLEDAENGLTDFFRQLLAQSYQQLQQLNEHIAFYDRALEAYGRENEACRRLQTVPGFGPIVSSVFQSVVGTGEAYRRGRDVSASLGLVPKQHSSGGKEKLLGISKRGNRYLRSLLVHGARAVVTRAVKKDDRLSRWINRVRAERGFNKAVIALANKMARIGWAVLRNNTIYQAA